MSPTPHRPRPVRSPDPQPGVSDVLFVCQANQCRSPYAEAIARRLGGTRPIRFTSGGLMRGGHPMPPAGRLVGEEIGLDFSSHRSREIDLGDLGGFDLILTMARSQARALVEADPAVWPRVFTLKQFARWIPEHARPRRAILGSWLDAAASDRPRDSIVGDSDADDVADPLRSPPRAWRAMAKSLTTLLIPTIDGVSKPG
jgi:protein-tyrosine-phosphatase